MNWKIVILILQIPEFSGVPSHIETHFKPEFQDNESNSKKV